MEVSSQTYGLKETKTHENFRRMPFPGAVITGTCQDTGSIIMSFVALLFPIVLLLSVTLSKVSLPVVDYHNLACFLVQMTYDFYQQVEFPTRLFIIKSNISRIKSRENKLHGYVSLPEYRKKIIIY
jgi:hypothetical protein